MDRIEERRSIRKYKPDEVSREVMDEIIKAGILAPSAKNRQPWKYLVYQGDSKEQLIEEMEKGIQREQSGNAKLPDSAHGIADARNTVRIMKQAPILIIILNTNGGSPFEPVTPDKRVTEICDTLSIGASVENILLKATDLGLGTLWIANTCFAYDELVKYIGTQSQLAGAILLGYAAEAPSPRPRKKACDVIEYR